MSRVRLQLLNFYYCSSLIQASGTAFLAFKSTISFHSSHHHNLLSSFHPSTPPLHSSPALQTPPFHFQTRQKCSTPASTNPAAVAAVPTAPVADARIVPYVSFSRSTPSHTPSQRLFPDSPLQAMNLRRPSSTRPSTASPPPVPSRPRLPAPPLPHPAHTHGAASLPAMAVGLRL